MRVDHLTVQLDSNTSPDGYVERHFTNVHYFPGRAGIRVEPTDRTVLEMDINGVIWAAVRCESMGWPHEVTALTWDPKLVPGAARDHRRRLSDDTLDRISRAGRVYRRGQPG